MESVPNICVGSVAVYVTLFAYLMFQIIEGVIKDPIWFVNIRELIQ